MYIIFWYSKLDSDLRNGQFEILIASELYYFFCIVHSFSSLPKIYKQITVIGMI